MSDTTDTTTVPDEQGNKDVEVEGKGDTAAPENKQEKTIPESQANKIAGKARAEGREAGKQAALKELEGKLVLTEAEYEAKVNEAVANALKQQGLVEVKRSIQTEYGLTDAQLAKLAGDDEKSLRADAEATFGALKQKLPPVVNPGNPKTEVSENEDLNTYLRKGIKRRTDLIN